MNASASTDNMRGCLVRTVANGPWPDAQVFVGRVPRASIGPLLETRLREMYRDRKWNGRSRSLLRLRMIGM